MALEEREGGTERERDRGRPFNGPGHVALSLTATDRQTTTTTTREDSRYGRLVGTSHVHSVCVHFRWRVIKGLSAKSMNLISTNVISLYISKESQQQLQQEEEKERKRRGSEADQYQELAFISV